jgi:metal-responsive CopG/Arc/MetJ family transcriptional regulator
MTEQPTKTEVIAVKASPEMLELLDRLADMNFTNRSQLVRRLIRQEAERQGLEYDQKVLYEST